MAIKNFTEAEWDQLLTAVNSQVEEYQQNPANHTRPNAQAGILLNALNKAKQLAPDAR